MPDCNIMTVESIKLDERTKPDDKTELDDNTMPDESIGLSFSDFLAFYFIPG